MAKNIVHYKVGSSYGDIKAGLKFAVEYESGCSISDGDIIKGLAKATILSTSEIDSKLLSRLNCREL